MTETNTGSRPNIMQLILVPAIITLAVTALRVVGELQHWPQPWFSTSAGGGGAIIGISWLPLIFGPYFALKLAGMGRRPSSVGKSIGFAALGVVLMFGGFAVLVHPRIVFPGKMLVGLLMILVAGGIQLSPWPSLFKTLLAYGYAARIPVAIVMYFAIQGNWGTHYDVVPPNYLGPTDLWGKYFQIGVLPQLILWPVFTVVIGSLFGSIAAAVSRRGRSAVQTAS